MDPKSPYEVIDLEYNNQQFKVYVYKHPNLIRDSTVFIVKTDPLIRKHIESVEDNNHLSETGKSSPQKGSIYKAIINAVGKHFYTE